MWTKAAVAASSIRYEPLSLDPETREDSKRAGVVVVWAKLTLLSCCPANLPLMDDGWFTVEGIDPSTYAISEYGHWEHPHSYVVLGQERGALIDSGLGVGNIKAVVERLTSLPVAVLTTHSHWDHIGGHDLFTDIAVHRLDARWLEHGIPTPLENQRATFMREALETQPPAGFALENWHPPRVRPTRLLEDHDKVALGARSLEILHTPGHSLGHIWIYDSVTGYLFTGDLVYSGTLHASYESTDPESFASSVVRAGGGNATLARPQRTRARQVRSAESARCVRRLGGTRTLQARHWAP
jgi:glyoxylase-like metal-dependent hydrolase (beta-lactamase superfamily II)